MTPEFWIGLALAGVASFFIGRRSASRHAEIGVLNAKIDTLTTELEAARTEAAAELAAAQDKSDTMERGVSDHFEQSAVLFGKLAHDYRAFFEHFSESATQLGVSEGVSRQLLAQLDKPLISGQAEPEPAIEGEAAPAAAIPPAAQTAEVTGPGRVAQSATGSKTGKANAKDIERPAAAPDSDVDSKDRPTPATSGPQTPPSPRVAGPATTAEPPTLDPISAKVAQIELEETTPPAPSRRAG